MKSKHTSIKIFLFLLSAAAILFTAYYTKTAKTSDDTPDNSLDIEKETNCTPQADDTNSQTEADNTETMPELTEDGKLILYKESSVTPVR